MEGYHEPVLLGKVLEYLRVKRDRWYLDCTLGDGGHSLEILRSGGFVYGVDVDPEALKRAEERFKDSGFGKDQFRLVQGNFRDLKNLILTQTEQTELKLAGAKSNLAGAVFDLGVSSLQLMDPERGFSFSKSGPLDMRMDPNLGIKALDLVNNLSRKEIYELLSKMGEEKYSWRLADAFAFARKVRAISSTTELASLIEKVVGRSRPVRIHPATRVFQALRIAVNDELNALKEGLGEVKDLIQNYGVICVISFHSLEDRIVKFTFREWEENGLGKILTKKPVVPSEDEIQTNPRSRSAKLRSFEIL